MERVEMHTAQPALLTGTKAAGATTDVRLALPVLSSIVFRKSTAQLPLMLSVETVCPELVQVHCFFDYPAIPNCSEHRFYRKTRIGGLQDQECIPCTKQTPTSEVQCAFQLSLVEADEPTVPPQEATLVALVSSLLVVFTLAFLGLFFLYCKQFFNRHCQRGKGGCLTGFLLQVAGGSLQFEADKAAEEESLFPMPPSKETSPESQVSESIFQTQPLNPILEDDCSSTGGFPTQESFTMASCASETHSHWVHNPIECTELDLQKFSSSASYTGAETLGENTAESTGDRLELNVPFEVPSP
ncbi:Tumor necrosis factor receptor super member 27 [Saguinus oedipus]|uniref:Tumor necrosis factor receptor super member 27 n=1 Tax=Saguinus oedipus TaxID=9490 RepID=A0ABQ9TEZ8_SAGOE|nr:Tumor necrosis factor receptor super member 27 [Saguinus oedipus]